jgi:hypothetical protein
MGNGDPLSLASGSRLVVGGDDLSCYQFFFVFLSNIDVARMDE